MMKKTIILAAMVIGLAGCGDYDNDNIPKLNISKEQARQLLGVVSSNWTCAAISRYSNDIGSPLEDQSYLQNAETALMILDNAVGNEDRDIKDGMNAVKDKLYKAVIADLNESESLQEFYEVAMPGVTKHMNAGTIRDCSDVSAATRRIIDPILMF